LSIVDINIERRKIRVSIDYSTSDKFIDENPEYEELYEFGKKILENVVAYFESHLSVETSLLNSFDSHECGSEAIEIPEQTNAPFDLFITV
jgi:hypothetical protein